MIKKLSLYFFILLSCFAQTKAEEESPQVFTPLHPTKRDLIPSQKDASPITSSSSAQKGISSLDHLILNKVSDIQEALADHYGKLETIQHQLETLKRSFDDLKKEKTVCSTCTHNLSNEKKQFMESENTASLEKKEGPSSANVNEGGAVQKTEEKPLSPEDQYNHARSLIVQGNYPEAREKLRHFIEANASHKLVPAAYYWLGETYFAEKNYADAAKTFLKGYQHNTKSNKASDFLLKLGLSLSNMNKAQEACKTFAKLRSEAPTLSATHKQIIEKEEEKLNCGK